MRFEIPITFADVRLAMSWLLSGLDSLIRRQVLHGQLAKGSEHQKGIFDEQIIGRQLVTETSHCYALGIIMSIDGSRCIQ